MQPAAQSGCHPSRPVTRTIDRQRDVDTLPRPRYTHSLRAENPPGVEACNTDVRCQPEFRQRLHARPRPGVVEPLCAGGGDAQAPEKEPGGNPTREREEVCGLAPTTPRGGKRDQQSGTSRTESLSRRGAAELFAVCGLRCDELQSACHRAGVAGAAPGARHDVAFGSLRLPNCNPPAKSDWRGVTGVGGIGWFERDYPKNQPLPPPPRKSHRSAPLPKTGVSGQRLISRAHRSDDPERLKSGSQVFDRFESLGPLLFRKFILEPGVIDRAIYEEYSWLS